MNETVGPEDAHNVHVIILSQTEVNGRAGDRLSLEQQAGADFDLTADAERVDALIALRLLGASAHLFPVIVPLSSTDEAHGLPAGRKTKQVEAAVVCNIDHRVDSSQRQRGSQRLQAAHLVAKPYLPID